MSAPDDVDPVLWQQAVEAAAKAIRRTSLGDQYPRLATTMRWQDYTVDGEAALSAAFGVLQQATRQQVGPMQYLTAYDCDGTVAAYWKRGLITPRNVPDWEPATADEVAAAAFRCPYCAGIFDGPGQCYIYDECVQAGPVVARGETP